MSNRHFGSTSLNRWPDVTDKYRFDTYRFVEKLESEGFSREQAEAIMNSLSYVIEERFVAFFWFGLTMLW